MSEQNPYTPPQALVADQTTSSDDPWQLVEPQRVPAGRGWVWIKEGYELFGRNPGIWIISYLVFSAIMIVISFLPLVSIGMYLLLPVFTGGLMLGCRHLDEGGRLDVGHLFAGFKVNGGKLVGVGGMYLLGSVVIGVVVFGVVFATVVLPIIANAGSGGGPPSATAMTSVFVAILVALVLFIPVLMAYWYAPVLVVLHDVDVMDALGMSFKASLRNMWPLTIYGLVMFVLLFVAMLPLFLGLLVMGPVIWTSTYASYKDIFLAKDHPI